MGLTDMPKISANEIINGFIDVVFREKTNNKIFPNIFIDRWECDLLEITKSGYTYEYEVKISRSDFKADARKQTFRQSKADAIRSGRTNYFYYITPKDLIVSDEVPEYAGLMYAIPYTAHFFSIQKGAWSENRMRFDVIKTAPILSSVKIDKDQLIKLLSVHCPTD